MNTLTMLKIYRLGIGLVVLSSSLPQPLAQPANVRSALTLIKQWQTEKTSYHARIDIEGQGIRQVANYYVHPVPGGRLWKVENQMIQPNEAHMILEETPSDIVAYFPEIDLHVLTKILPQDVDLISPSFQGLTDVEAVLAAAKNSALNSENGVNELTLVFDPKKLGVHPTTADITIIARFDNAGQINQIEQRRLGLVQTATLTYITFNIDDVKAAMPATPDPALADASMSYEEAIQESIIYFAKERQRQRNRL